jgi:hypothetical protein
VTRTLAVSESAIQCGAVAIHEIRISKIQRKDVVGRIIKDSIRKLNLDSNDSYL